MSIRIVLSVPSVSQPYILADFMQRESYQLANYPSRKKYLLESGCKVAVSQTPDGIRFCNVPPSSTDVLLGVPEEMPIYLSPRNSVDYCDAWLTLDQLHKAITDGKWAFQEKEIASFFLKALLRLPEAYAQVAILNRLRW